MRDRSFHCMAVWGFILKIKAIICIFLKKVVDCDGILSRSSPAPSLTALYRQHLSKCVCFLFTNRWRNVLNLNTKTPFVQRWLSEPITARGDSHIVSEADCITIRYILNIMKLEPPPASRSDDRTVNSHAVTSNTLSRVPGAQRRVLF